MGCSAHPPAARERSLAPGERAPYRILLTNDDGIDAPGLEALRGALSAHPERFEVTVVAPKRDRSGSGTGKTGGDLPVEMRGPRAFAVDGTPTDCVTVALGTLVGSIDLVISGMNFGANTGAHAFTSGTIGAALTAASRGIPAVAVSVAADGKRKRTLEAFSGAADFTVRLASELLARPQLLGSVELLSVNYPALAPERIAGVRVTRQSNVAKKTRSYELAATRTAGSRTRKLTAERRRSRPATDLGPADGDLRALEEGWISVTPLVVNWTAPGAGGAVSDLLKSLPARARER
jgi:5'-nucleotidase